MHDQQEYLSLESAIVQVLKGIYDPEIPVNIYDLGLIYDIQVDDENAVEITMTLTAPNCPIADSLIQEVEQQIRNIEGVKSAQVHLVFDPPWDKDMMSDEAKLELGLL